MGKVTNSYKMLGKSVTGIGYLGNKHRWKDNSKMNFSTNRL